MTSVPDLRLAICRRCRWPERRASGASTDDALLAHARARVSEGGEPMHCRLVQCLNCCDGGHTVRVEHRGREVALVGIRTEAELDRVIASARAIGEGALPARLARRVYQVWQDGRMTFHRSVTPAELEGADGEG